MIRVLLSGMARAVFAVAVSLAVAAALLFYGSYRILKAGLGKQPTKTPPREAAFGVLVALVVLARALGVKPPAPGSSSGVADVIDLAALAEYGRGEHDDN